MDIRDIVAEILEKKNGKENIHRIYFVACGGSLGAFVPAKSLIEAESTQLTAGLFNSGEFIHNVPKGFAEGSVLIVASHRGNTPETVEAARLGKEKGIPVIALTFSDDTPIYKWADYIVKYTFGDDKYIGDEKPVQALKLAAEFVHQVEGYANYQDFYSGIERIDGIVKTACIQVADRAARFALEYKDDRFFYTMGSGASGGAAYMEAICIFMEMQWINSSYINSGEFFHGPFEITDDSVPFFIQIAEGKTRAVDERALKFLNRYAKRVEVLDAKELGLSTIPETVVDYFNHSLFNNVYNVYNHALADVRKHPLTTRRYMWKVEY